MNLPTVESHLGSSFGHLSLGGAIGGLLDPEGMKIALAAELTSSDVAQAPAPDQPAKAVRTA